MAVKFLNNIDVSGEVEGTSLDINGNADISGTLTMASDQKTSYGNAATFIEGATSGSKLMLNGQTDMFMRINGSTVGQFDSTKFTLSVGLDLGGHTVNDIDITSEASNADDHLMTALAIKNRIEDYGYITSSGNTSGNAATATALATARAIGGVSFDGTAAIDLPGVNTSGNQDTSGTAAIATAITVADESSDTSCNVLFTTSASGNLNAKSGTNLTFNSSSGVLTATGFNGALTGNVTGNVSGNAGGTAKGLSHLDSETALTAHGVIVANTDGDGITQVTGNALASNKFLRSRGTASATAAPTFETVDYASISGTPSLGSLAGANSINNSNWSGTDLAIANGGTGGGTASAARTNLGLAIGSDVQAYDAQLADVAGLAVTDGGFIVGNGSNFVLESGATARTSLGLGTGAVLDTAAIADGGTGLATADQIHTFVTGLGYVTSSGITSVDDSTANTAFPVVFHDESNGLLDDTGALTYNPSSGRLETFDLGVRNKIYADDDSGLDTYILFADGDIDIMVNDTNLSDQWSDAYSALSSSFIGSTNHQDGVTFTDTESSDVYTTTIKCDSDFLIFNMDHGGANNNALTLTHQGLIGFNRTNPSYGVHDSRASGTESDYYLVNGSMGLGTTPRAADSYIDVVGDVYTGVSDKRFKTNIRPYKNPIEKVKSLNGFTYNYNDLAKSVAPKTYGHNNDMAGVFAQEVQKVVPEAVLIAPCDSDEHGKSISGENYLTVNYDKLVPLLIEAIKEQQEQIEELKTKVYGNTK